MSSDGKVSSKIDVKFSIEATVRTISHRGVEVHVWTPSDASPRRSHFSTYPAATRWPAATPTIVRNSRTPKRTKSGARRRGKTDTIDAEAAARAVLSGQATARAKTGDGPVEMVRLFRLAKASAVKSRTQAINQLKAVLVCADPLLRDSLAGLSTPRLIGQCAALPTDAPGDIATAAAYMLQC
jgi:hypothetical protein